MLQFYQLELISASNSSEKSNLMFIAVIFKRSLNEISKRFTKMNNWSRKNILNKIKFLREVMENTILLRVFFVLMYSCHHWTFFLFFFYCFRYQKSSFNTYTPSLAPYVSIVPTSSSALLIRPPTAIQQQQASSILIGSGGFNNNNSSILAQSPSNLGKERLGPRVCALKFLHFW